MKFENVFLYCIASAMCCCFISAESSISAIVLPIFRMLAVARGENPYLFCAYVSSILVASSILQNEAVSAGVRQAFFFA